MKKSFVLCINISIPGKSIEIKIMISRQEKLHTQESKVERNLFIVRHQHNEINSIESLCS